ncbi:antibiotic biosynthesis monooxygenase [Epibacterium ulvae]|uniref:putative quinol monooxygenase n=1 Tax=Epibacterium ulvae TaxID=1156985 RepID=UPI001BFC30BA|nr:antibiotic biosynthesis monooxygenase [Epibacterium ulvae]MBT8154370.1 antibiotic biosynthesis monooxygenase [Epibacterium ulvae]
MPVTLTGHIDVPLDRLDEVETALQDHIRLTRAEPGCLSFEVTPHATIAGRLEVQEAFVNQEAFDAHQARTLASPWAETTRGIDRNYMVSIE